MSVASLPFRVLRVCLLSLLTIFTAAAQIRSGSISGSVRDASGAAIPEVAVMVAETQTNQIYKTETNSAGGFTVPYLPPGVYTVTLEKAGFGTGRQSDINLGTAETVRVELALSVRSVETAVEVSASAIAIQTESATLQGTTGEQVIQAVPNINHNPLYYAILQAGATPRASMSDTDGQNSFGIGINGRRQLSAFAINGGRAFENDIQVDGVSVQGSAWNEAAVLPNPDGLQEVKVSVNNYSAEYGRGMGVVSMTTKSGTNGFHGSGFWRHRNEALNANTFSNNARGIARPAQKIHTFGGTMGGRIVRDKAFFFASYEGLRFNDGNIYLRTVPTELERRGDFSQTFANVNGVPVPLQLFNPYSVSQTGPNVFRRTPISNSIIQQPNAAALRLIGNYPLPNRTPDNPAFNTNNFLRTASSNFDRRNLNSRVDYRAAEKHSIYFTGGITYGKITNPLTWADDNLYNSAINEQGSRFVSDRNPYFGVGDTWVISPSFVLDIRYGLNRIRTGSLADDTPDFDYAAVGIPANIESAMAVRRVPNFFSAGQNPWANLNNNAYMHKDERQTNHVLAGSATKIAGQWTLKFGGEMRQLLSNYTDAQEAISYRINSSYTAGSDVNANGGIVGTINNAQNGHAWASLLLGAGNLEIGRGFNAKPAFKQSYYALYTQNDWRPTSKLTLNLGLRWDVQPGTTDRFNRISSFDDEGTTAAFNNSRGAFVFPGSAGAGRNLWQTQRNNFGPRFGAAYRVTDDFVVRGGYGLTYLPSNTGFFDGPFNYGMQSFAPYTDALPFGTNPQGVLVGDFAQVTRLVDPTNADPLAPALYGSPGPRFAYRDYKTGRVHQTNVFLERKLGQSWTVAAGWSGSFGRDLPLSRVSLNSDQFIDPAVLGQWRQDYISRNGTGNAGGDQIPNPFQPATGPRIPFLGPLSGATLSRNITFQPYPLFTGLSVQRTEGWSNYNALVLQANKQFSAGLLLNAHYTWSKSLEFANGETQNNFGAEGFGNQIGNQLDYSQNYKLSSNDIPQRLVVSAVYQLPFGKGRAFAPANAVVSALLSGWQLGGVWSVQSGTPVVLSGASNGALNGRPDIVPDVDFEVPKELQRWYDGQTTVSLPSGRQIRPCAFCFLKYNPDKFQGRLVPVANGSLQRDVYWWGNSAQTYNELRNPGLNNVNLSVQRIFRVTESMQLELQANAQNLLNHTQFSPSLNMGLGNTEILNNPSSGQLPGAGQNANYGTYGLATYDPRQIEVQVKFRF